VNDWCWLNVEECAAVSGHKERMLLDYVRAYEDEVNQARQENQTHSH
jgi:hypothetical protein